MGVSESLARNRGGLNDVFNLYARYQQKKAQDEERAAFRDRLKSATADVTENIVRPDNSADTGNLQIGGGGVDTTGNDMRGSTIVPKMQPMGMVGQSKIPLERFIESRPKTLADMDLNDVIGLNQQAGEDPVNRGTLSSVMQMLSQREERNTPTYNIMNQEDGGYDIFKMLRGKAPERVSGRLGVQKPVAQARTKYGVDQVVSDDGYYVDVVKNPDTGETQYRKTNVRAPEKDWKGGAGASGSGKPGELTDAEKRIAQLTQVNLELGKEMTNLGLGLDKSGNPLLDAQGKKIADTTAIKDNLQSQLKTNEAELVRLNQKIGGTYKGSDAGAGSGAGTGTNSGRKVVQTGMLNGKKVVKYDDGSVEYGE